MSRLIGRPRRARPWWLILTALFALLVASSPATAAVIGADGPLNQITTTADLTCAVHHVGDGHSEFYGENACETAAVVDGSYYGPFGETAWSPISQQTSGSGAASDPYRIVSKVAGGPLELTQTDTYVEGSEAYGTRIDVHNVADVAKEVTLYRAADCFLQDSDFGYGRVWPDSGAVACVAGPDDQARVEQWAPLTPGSHYYESYYGSVWNWIRSKQPFPDTCDCATHQDNGAGLSWTKTIPAGATASFSHLTAFSPSGATNVQDTDGDSLPDEWEKPDGGVDTDGDGDPDLKLSDYGATADTPDVFLQVGWTTTRTCTAIFFCSTKNRRPSLAALSDVQQAFKRHGIRLHIDAGPDSIMDPDTGAKWGSRSRAGDGVEAPSTIPGETQAGFDWHTAFDGYRRTLLLHAGSDTARDRLFHFVLYVGKFDGSASGLARRGGTLSTAGRDLMFAHDVFTGGAPTRIKESGTVMHELGHNLGLSHGGSWTERHLNFKPNYPSVMNYAWQLSGVAKDSQLGALDYSEGTLDAVDESQVSETAGLSPDDVASDTGTRWACPGVIPQTANELHALVPSVFNVDWNCNGLIDGGTSSQDLNGDGDIGVLSDWNDWSGLSFDGNGALGGAGDSASVEDVTPVEEPPVATLEATTGDLHTVGVTGPGQLNIQAGTKAPVQIALTNHRATARTYQLGVTAEGVQLTGLPATATLAADETRTVTGVLTAPVPRNDAFYEVDLTSDDPTDAASSIAEVFVVAQPVPDQPSLDQPNTNHNNGQEQQPQQPADQQLQTTTPQVPDEHGQSQQVTSGIVVLDALGRFVTFSIDGRAKARVGARHASSLQLALAGTHRVTVEVGGRRTSVRLPVADHQLATVVVSRRGKRLHPLTFTVLSGQRMAVSLLRGRPRAALGTRRLRLTSGVAVQVPGKATTIRVGGHNVALPQAQLTVLEPRGHGVRAFGLSAPAA